MILYCIAAHWILVFEIDFIPAVFHELLIRSLFALDSISFKIMVNKCSAVGCRNGYEKNTDKSLSFHSFPKDEFTKSAWLRRLRRENFEPTVYSRLCSEHFTEHDFITERQDSKSSRKIKSAPDLIKR